jgi:hypothetical protein
MQSRLLHFDLRTGFFQLLLQIVGFVLANTLLDWFRSGSVDQFLRFLQAQTGDRTHFFDHIDLVCAGFRQDESNSVFSSSAAAAAAAAGPAAATATGAAALTPRRSSKSLDQLGNLKNGQTFDVRDKLLHLRHSIQLCFRLTLLYFLF